LNNSTKCSAQEEAIQCMTKTTPRTFPDVILLPTTPNKMENIINYLKSKNLYGYDGISTKLLKTYSDSSCSFKIHAKL
jgi:hypothetical protein